MILDASGEPMTPNNYSIVETTQKRDSAVKQRALAQRKAEAGTFENNVINGLSDLTGILGFGNNWGGSGAPASQTNTMYYNNRWYMISNNRILLTEMYVEHGIVQTLVDQPVDDGFRAGFEIKSSQLSAEEIEELQVFCEQFRVIDAIMQAIKWARLYGGGAVIVVTDQDPSTPLNYNELGRPGSYLGFIAADLWELYFANINMPEVLLTQQGVPYYDYYGIQVHASRVFPVKGKQAPSFIRPRLRGWGMSELERMVRSINQYLKNQDVIFELLDEAKVDVYKIKGFTQTLMTQEGTSKVANRIQQANLIKNYNNALTMDIDDDYDQKQMTFTGLAEMLQQIRIQVASDLKMPVTKLFGLSAAGFSSGEDDIENYNSMIEGEIRSKSKFIVIDVLKICCQKLFGVIPDDLKMSWNPLRILSAEQEENVKEKKFNRIDRTFNMGLCSDKEAKSSINKDSLLPIEIDEATDAQLPFDSEEDLTINKKKEIV